MTNKRKSLSKKLRFEVFKRDKFTCQYCGKKAPDVILQADHIEPVAMGGKNTLLNLITSCEGCNAGKGARKLTDDSVLEKQRDQLESLATRREQIDMMLEWSKGLGNLKDYEVNSVSDRIESRLDIDLSESAKAKIRRWLANFTIVEVLDALEISASQYSCADEDGFISAEQTQRAFDSIPGIARIRKLPPDEQGCLYVRGIVRRRFDFCNEPVALSLIRESLSAGTSIEYLKDVAREESNWTRWVDRMHSIIDGGE